MAEILLESTSSFLAPSLPGLSGFPCRLATISCMKGNRRLCEWPCSALADSPLRYVSAVKRIRYKRPSFKWRPKEFCELSQKYLR
jgi:hypothetical protein